MDEEFKPQTTEKTTEKTTKKPKKSKRDADAPSEYRSMEGRRTILWNNF